MGLTDQFPTLDPEIAAFLEAMPKRAPCSIEEERQWLEAGVAKSQEATNDQLPSGHKLSHSKSTRIADLCLR